MKKRIFIVLAITLTLFKVNAQECKADKPSLLILPSEAWCMSNGYYVEYDNQGKTEKLPDYKKAFQENIDLKLVISTLNGMMAERGFPIENAETALKTLSRNSAEDNIRTSSRTSSSIAKSQLDELKSVLSPEIVIELTYEVESIGPKKYIKFIMQGLDFYSNKEIATATGNGTPSFSTAVPILLEEACNSHIEKFANSLQVHFDDLFKNGREVQVTVQVWDDWGEDFYSEFGNDGLELQEIIEEWMAENSIGGTYNPGITTNTIQEYKNLRIPMTYKNSSGNCAPYKISKFASDLKSFLDKQYGIESMRENAGLSKVLLILGHK